ncbi:hypothetical protein [Aquimarina sp. 2201CG14-23]|uniref:hypothetical protein n=1 Tax=Aquimarina mycalae TaxID=3040073 RepID=UPI002477DC7B|nr:hypothetical protein [Aquimarina sp. 2201CG14-23]MDH7447237.1 hypothetical protein [Aquimarina sp. 2201CG14-23]
MDIEKLKGFIEVNFHITEEVLENRGILKKLESTSFLSEIYEVLEKSNNDKIFKNETHKLNYALYVLETLKHIRTVQKNNKETISLINLIQNQHYVSLFHLFLHKPERVMFIEQSDNSKKVLEKLLELSQGKKFNDLEHKRRFALHMIDSTMLQENKVQ